MTRTEILDALRGQLLLGGFVAVDDLSPDEEIYLCAHTGPDETDDTPLTHINFTPAEIATADDAIVKRMISDRVALAFRSSAERRGQIRKLQAAAIAEQASRDEVQHTIDLREASEADRLARIEAARAVLTALGGW